MKRIIFDCDNTLGIDKCDVDDGLALLYLTLNEECELEAITTTYGNNAVDIVTENTKKMIKEFDLHNIEIIKGGKNSNDFNNGASVFLAKYCSEHEGEISILATGSLTNIYGAYRFDEEFFDNIKELVIMGGITEELEFPNKNMGELNLSSDFRASYEVINACSEDKLSVITGNSCLDLLFDHNEFCIENMSSRAIQIYECVKNWTAYISDEYGTDGFYNWDVIAAIYLLHKEFFDTKKSSVDIDINDLVNGFLKIANQGSCETDIKNIQLPKMKCKKEIKNEFFTIWERL